MYALFTILRELVATPGRRLSGLIESLRHERRWVVKAFWISIDSPNVPNYRTTLRDVVLLVEVVL